MFKRRPAIGTTPAPIIATSPALAELKPAPSANTCAHVPAARISIRPQAILEVVRRRGHSWGLLAQYEEARLLKR